MLCRFESFGDRWRCTTCHRVVRMPCKAHCRLLVVKSCSCSLAEVVSQLTPAGITRLQLCRSSDCRLMLSVDGQIRCTGMPGRKCQWIGEWVARLNGEKEFSTGGNACPFWITSDPPVPPPAAPATNPPPLDIAAGH
jgi:hypothetical protein